MEKTKYREKLVNYRQKIAELASNITDEQWNSISNCSAWTVGELLQHVRLMDTFPSKVPLKSLVKRGKKYFQPLRLTFNQWYELESGKGQKYSVAELDKPAGNFFDAVPLLRSLRLVETVIHLVDLQLSLGGDYQELKIDDETAWECAKFVVFSAGIKVRKVAKLTISADKFGFYTPRFVFAKGNWVVVEGKPLELALHLSGRRSEGVSFTGDHASINAVNKIDLSF